MINQVLIATTGDAAIDEANKAIQNRSLLYNKDKKKLFIKYDEKLNPVGSSPDNKNIIEDANGNTALKDIPQVKGVTIQQPGSDNWRGQRLLASLTKDKNILLFFPNTDLNAYIGGELLQKGGNLHGHYEISLTSSGSRSFKGASTDNKKANLISCIYQGKTWYGIRFSSIVSSKVFFSGWFNKAVVVVGGSDVSEVIDLNDNADTGTVIITDNSESWNYEFDQHIPELDNYESHANYKFDDLLEIITSEKTRINYQDTLTDSQGSIINIGNFEQWGNTDKNHPMLRVHTTKKIRIDCMFTPYKQGQKATLRYEYKGGAVSTSCSDIYRPGTLTYTTNGPIDISCQGDVYLWYIKIQEDTSIDGIITEIENLPETGINGTPHRIVLENRILSKADLYKLSEACQKATTQVIIDLSQSTVAGDAVDWEADHGNGRRLNSLFSGCRSLRKFLFPKGVKNAGAFVFQNCPSLDQVVLNEDLEQLGLNGWSDVNTGFFQGSSISKFWLPKEYKPKAQTYAGWLFASSDILDVWFTPDSWLKRNWTQAQQGGNYFGWGYFAYCDDRIRLHMPCSKLANGQWNLNDGELYSISQKFGTFNASSYNMNIASNKYAFKDKPFKNICIPYDITEYERLKEKDNRIE